MLGLPEFIISPIPQRVFNGSDFILDCVADGSPPPTITWLLNMWPVDLTSGSYEVFDNGSLLVMEAGEDTVGLYTCVADNGYGRTEITVAVDIREETMATNNNTGEVILII